MLLFRWLYVFAVVQRVVKVKSGLVAIAILVTMILVGCSDDPTPSPVAEIPLSPTAAEVVSPTPTPAPTSTPTAMATATPAPTLTPAPTARPAPASTPTPTATTTPVATSAPTPTATPTPTSMPAATSVPGVTAAPENEPPTPTGEFEDIAVSVGGSPWPFLASGLFRDLDNDAEELTFTATVSDPALASSEVIVDSEGHTAIIVTGTAAGSATLTVTATDPGGLSGEQSMSVEVDDSGFTLLPGIKVDNNKIDLGDGFLTLTDTCTPPIKSTPFPSGLVVTINSSEWHTRSDSSSAWMEVPETEVTTGQLCTYATRTAGEYRLVLNVTIVIDPHLPTVTGEFRAENEFIVEESTGENRGPTLNEDVILDFDELSAGGGPLFTEPTLFFTDPDGDELEFSLELSDPAVLTAEIVTDVAGHRFLVFRGTAAGSAMLTLTATDPDGLSADFALEIDVDDEGLTPFPTIDVANGVVLLYGRSFGTCLGPFINQEIARYFYTVHSMKWQTRADSSAEWTDIEGTTVTDGQLCPYTTNVAGDYRMVMELSIQPDEHVSALRGFYTAANTFTVSGEG